MPYCFNSKPFALRTGGVAAAFVIVSLAGCAGLDETQRNTGIGAGVGAGAGAVLGGVISGGRGAAVGAVIGGAAGGIGTYVWSKRMQQQKAEMEQATRGTGVAVVQTPDNQLKLEVPSDVSFDVGRADIKAGFRPVLDKFAQTLNEHRETSIRIVGHTDSSGSDAINNPLSVNRAASARQYLVDKGVDTKRIAIDGQGSHQPVADNTSEAGRAKNRRIEVFVAEAAPAPAAGTQPAR